MLCQQSAGRVVGLPWLPAGSQELVPLAPGRSVWLRGTSAVPV